MGRGPAPLRATPRLASTPARRGSPATSGAPTRSRLGPAAGRRQAPAPGGGEGGKPARLSYAAPASAPGGGNA